MMEHSEVDVVTVGAGWTAGIAAQQLTEAGWEVVSLEKGRAPWTRPDFAHNRDELRCVVRKDLLAPAATRSREVRSSATSEPAVSLC